MTRPSTHPRTNWKQATSASWRLFLGATVAAAFAVVPAAHAGSNPFEVSTPTGTTLLAMQGGKCGDAMKEKKDGKCGEGKCGDAMKAHKEGKCGEGKCGDAMKAHKEGKCGEGKCGDAMKEHKEGKCGEGKCGDAMKEKKAEKSGKCGEGKCGGK